MLEALTRSELFHAIQRKTHQQGHDARQAKAGQQGDFPLNGQLLSDMETSLFDKYLRL
jgi:hypothetical protein